MEPEDAGETFDEQLADEIARRVAGRVIDFLTQSWQFVKEDGPGQIADAVASQLGQGWPLLGEERWLRRQAESRAEVAAQARTLQEIDAIASRVVELLDRRDKAREQARTATNSVGRRGAVMRVPPRLLTNAQAGDYLGTSASTISALIKKGEIRTVWSAAGKSRRIDIKELDRFVEEDLTARGRPLEEEEE